MKIEKLTGIVFLFFLTFFILTASGHDQSEGAAQYPLAELILKSRALGMPSSAEFGDKCVVNQSRIYFSHDAGVAFAMLPVAAVNLFLESVLKPYLSFERIGRVKHFLVSFMPAVCSAVSAALFFNILVTVFDKKKKSAFYATILLAVTTFFWGYTRYFYDGVLLTPVIMFSFLKIARLKTRENYTDLMLAAAALGFGFLTRPTAVLAIPAVSVYFLTLPNIGRKFKIKGLLLAVFVFLPFALWQCWYNYVRVGAFYLSPSITEKCAQHNLTGTLLEGLAGYIFSPGKSFFVYCPLVLAGLFFLKEFLKNFKAECFFILIYCLLWVFVHARLSVWHSEWGLGPRYLIVILPFAFLPFAVYWDKIDKMSYKIPVFFLGLWGGLLAFSSIIINWHYRHMYAHVEGRDVFEKWIWSVSGSETLDMISGAYHNICRVLGREPIIYLQGYSMIGQYESNTLYLWPVLLIHAGVPWILPVFAFLLILSANLFFLKLIRRNF